MLKLRGKNFYMRIYPILHKENSRNIVSRWVLSPILSVEKYMLPPCTETLQEMSISTFGYACGNTRDTKQINTYGKAQEQNAERKKQSGERIFPFAALLYRNGHTFYDMALIMSSFEMTWS